MSNDREQLIAEANLLGLEFPSNVKTVKLMGMVAEAKGEPPPLDEIPPPGPAMKDPDPDEEEEENDEEAPAVIAEPKRSRAQEKAYQRRLFIANKKKKAFETRVVTLTNKDNRENDVMTTAYLSFENQYFGISKLVPLDIPVELENGLIRVAEGTTITLHKDEIVGGKRTGNKVPVTVKKFAISYAKITD